MICETYSATGFRVGMGAEAIKELLEELDLRRRSTMKRVLAQRTGSSVSGQKKVPCYPPSGSC